MGLIPDVANAREAATGWRKKFYSICRTWMAGHRPAVASLLDGYLLLAGLATPLVISVHSVVSLGLRDGAVAGMA